MQITTASLSAKGSRRSLYRFQHLSLLQDWRYVVCYLQENHKANLLDCGV